MREKSGPSGPPVSPAYAGIDLNTAVREPMRIRFPRIRGDRPCSPTSRKPWPEFPPHTRGSTFPRAFGRQWQQVSPAYAGIDPLDAIEAIVNGGFPRIRGDRPPPGSYHLGADEFPPHTRGSTALSRRLRRLVCVSPAYAGIDRGAMAKVDTRRRFPRIRGDRPIVYVMPDEELEFPPHTRGSTYRAPRARARDAVSPAYAGIDLADQLGFAVDDGFPRIRGDRPAPGVPRFGGAWFPPHTRGSTQQAYDADEDAGVSPAYAGIDLQFVEAPMGLPRFPRIRGDRPSIDEA